VRTNVSEFATLVASSFQLPRVVFAFVFTSLLCESNCRRVGQRILRFPVLVLAGDMVGIDESGRVVVISFGDVIFQVLQELTISTTVATLLEKHCCLTKFGRSGVNDSLLFSIEPVPPIQQDLASRVLIGCTIKTVPFAAD
jgi:hypothetical protein